MTRVIEFPRIQAAKAVIFARVSSREQEDGYSIEAQKHRLKIYCEKHGLEVIRVYEIIESSTRGDRTKFMEMIKFCKQQKQPIAIVADKVDRVQRSFKEYPLLDGLIQEGKIELHFNTEGYAIHKDSVSHERIMWSFGVIMAQSYVDSLRHHAKRAIDHKIRIGEYVSCAPLGYLNIRVDGRADITIDANRAPLVKQLFSEFSTGNYSVPTLTKAARNWGLVTRKGNALSRSQIYEILYNPFYYGLMSVRGNLHPHRYPPLIDKHLFDKCQEVFARYNKTPYAYGEKEYVFRGNLICKSTGKTVSPLTRSKTYANGSKGEWNYLYSWDRNGKHIYIREDKILAQVQQALEGIVVSPEGMEIMAEYMRTANRVEHEYLKRTSNELNKEHEKIQTRLTSLMELLMDGAITKDEYDVQRGVYLKKQMDLKNQLNANQAGDDGFKESLMLLLELSSKASGLFASCSIEQKRKIINFVFCNLSLDEATLSFDYKIPFGQIAESAKSGKWCQLYDFIATNPLARMEIIAFGKVHGEVVTKLLKILGTDSRICNAS